MVNTEFLPGNTTSIVLDEAGVYDIMQIVWNNNFVCADTAYVQIIVDALVDMTVPNIVTPNGDGKNDVFVLSLAGIKDINTMIYNRWGNLVFEKETTITEDGLVEIWNPEDITQGVYFYLIRALDMNGQRMVKDGSLQVLR
jgi:gliding motility-associated-like protein